MQYDGSTYGDRIADVYDELHTESELGPVEPVVAFLKDLAGGGPALELGIGTGRVALPLREAGVEVHGIDASQRMVERLRSKPRGTDIPVRMGDFADFSIAERFRLVYVVFNTIFGLLSQEEQVTCFSSVARHLTDDGKFVVEAFVPDPALFTRRQRVSARTVDVDEVVLDVGTLDPTNGRVDAQQIVLRDGDVRLYPVKLRFAFPSELDLMARLAGLRLRERWAGWDRAPFEPASGKHVSVYELDPSSRGVRPPSSVS